MNASIRWENVMRLRKSMLVSMVAAATAVLVLAVTLLATRGVVEALVLIFIVAGLTGLYWLRRYARAELLYRRHAELRGQASRTAPGREPVNSGFAEASD